MALLDKNKNSGHYKDNSPFINFKMTQKRLSAFAAKIRKASGQNIEEIIAELSNPHL